METVLLTQYYKVNTDNNDYDIKRQKELDYCLLKNVQNNYIGEIHLLVETIYDLDNIIPIKYISKIKQVNINKRLTYLDAFTYYNNNLLGKICILTNADIYTNESLYMMEHINFNFDIFLCCMRYEVNNDDPPLLYGMEYDNSKLFPFAKSCEPVPWSQDVWIWKTNNMMRLLNNKYDFMLGISGCDNYLCKLLLDDYYTILNPASLLAFNHYDNLSTIIEEYGIRKGGVSGIKKRLGTINDYVFLENIFDIPDKYTKNINNYTSLENQLTMKKYNVNIKNVNIIKNIELVPLNNNMIKVSSSKENINLSETKINSTNYWSPSSNDLSPYIQINLPNSIKIPYIDIMGNDSTKSNSPASYIKKIKILYSASDIDMNTYMYENETTCIDIPNINYIKRIYFKEPIY
jgi:hypothetical protein